MSSPQIESNLSTSANKDVVLQLKNISKTFKNEVFKKHRSALDNLCISFEKGKCSGLLGHNGAGKTTAIRIILGILFADRGEILFNGTPITSSAKLQIGYMPEINKLAGNMTPREILASQLRLYCPNLSRRERERMIDAKLQQVQLTAHQNKRIKHLSKGMGRRIAWAQASIHGPALLILDEPFSGLDPVGRREMQIWIESEKTRGVSIILCTHEFATVEALCDSIYILQSGHLAYTSDNFQGVGTAAEGLHQYLLHVSGTTEKLIDDLRIQFKLPPWQDLRQEGWSTKLSFREYGDASAWLATCLGQGLLIISFASDASRSEAILLPYFAEKGLSQ